MAWKSFHLAAGIISAAALPFYAGSTGAAALPPGPCLVAAHHSGFLDGPLLAMAYARARLRPLHMIAYGEPFDNWLMGWILRSGGAIPFQRGNRDSQERMLVSALGWLAAGEAVGIFPEAHINRTRRLNSPRSGLALLALESGVPVIPAAITGSEKTFPPGASWPHPGRRIRVVFGQPIPLMPKETRYRLLPADERRIVIANLGLRIMTVIARLAGKEPPEE